MSNLLFTAIALFGSIIAGFIGSLTGLGGGLLLVPLLTIVGGVDIHYAIGTSLVSIIATSSGASQNYLQAGLVNIRVAMYLGIPTTLGAIIGAFIGLGSSKDLISIIFGTVLFITAVFILFKTNSIQKKYSQDSFATFLKLNSRYVNNKETLIYNVRSVQAGTVLMFFAGILSSLLGIGSGVIKVPALDNCMKLPYKVSTATSTLMIGVTALAGVWIYIPKGYIDPLITFPTVLGVLFGAYVGAKVMPYIKTRNLKILFSIVAMIIAIKMVYNAI